MDRISMCDGIELLANERLEDLQYRGLRIIQSADGFRFGTDSVLLAGFSKASPRERAVDLCSGSGVIAILLNGRTGAAVTALELQPRQCQMAERSAKLNSQHDITVINADLRNVASVLPRSAFDVVVCNPPYHSAERGFVSQKGDGSFEGAATHSITCSLVDVAKCTDYLLRFGGRLYICCPTSRFAEFITTLSNTGLEPKRLRLVASREHKPPYLALIECKKSGNAGLVVEPTLTIYDASGSYTDELNQIYHRK